VARRTAVNWGLLGLYYDFFGDELGGISSGAAEKLMYGDRDTWDCVVKLGLGLFDSGVV
jgi:hypothetical protein